MTTTVYRCPLYCVPFVHTPILRAWNQKVPPCDSHRCTGFNGDELRDSTPNTVNEVVIPIEIRSSCPSTQSFNRMKAELVKSIFY